ncbi:MAG: GNAT family N-acetyltransferase [Alphaproteobacteria bacterium]|jgi:[ribosomal protein S18]-alanine N-acetyltransferase|nr:GNAT family N-acetyltransferase [Candidatus Puniceispirillum sp.]MDP4632348.1 GNAT family N-acetyltransferase [Porticoccaceae bacterium]MDP4924564.1 GNAT family N-acetyltransferase [Alphaproteobacteria bacterium]
MIRRIAPVDCDAIAALEARLFATALDQARLMALQANPVFCGFVDLVPEQDQPQSTSADDLASYLGGYLLAMMIDDEAEILSIGVTPDRQRQGVGKLLLQHFFEHGTSQNMTRVVLEVAEDNVPALGLYRDFGFAAFGRRKGYYKQGNQKIDAIMMKWCRAEAFP